MEKSLFEEKNKVILETRNLQDTTQTMTGPVQQPLDMQQDQNLNANHIQVEENLQKLEVEQNLELLTDAEREMAIEKAYEEHKKGTQLAALDKKSKRAKNMKKKVEYWKKSKSFKPPEPENLGKLISEAGDVSDYSMEDGAAILEAEIRALKIKNDKAFSDNMESNFAILAKLDKFKAEFCKAVNTK